MPFIARYRGECGFCGDELKDTETSFASDKTLVHSKCLVPYSTGVDPMATMAHRNEITCGDCFTIHTGECA